MKRFLAFSILMIYSLAFTNTMSWNQNQCQIYLDELQNYSLIVNDKQKHTLINIKTLFLQSYMKFDETIEVYYLQNNAKAISIELLNKTEDNNCPVRILKNEPRRNLVAACSSSINCYACALEPLCYWDTKRCIPSESRNSQWIFKSKDCLDKNETHNLNCPSDIGSINKDFSAIFNLPPSNRYMGAYEFCYWSLENPDNLEIIIDVARTKVNLVA